MIELERMRKAAGVTRRELAISLGMTEKSIQNWEKGGDPRHSIALAVERFFHDRGFTDVTYRTLFQPVPVQEGISTP